MISFSHSYMLSRIRRPLQRYRRSSAPMTSCFFKHLSTSLPRILKQLMKTAQSKGSNKQLLLTPENIHLICEQTSAPLAFSAYLRYVPHRWS